MRRSDRSGIAVLFCFLAGLLAVSCQTLPAVRPPISEPELRFEPPQAADGGLVRLELLLPPNEKPALVRGRLGKTEFAFYPARNPREQSVHFEALVAVPFGTQPGKFEVPVEVLREGKVALSLRAVIPVVAGGYASETLTVDPRHVKPDPVAQKRIREESADIGWVYRNSEPTMFWSGSFDFPITSPLTSPFGTKRVYNGAMQSFHTGLDLRAAVGTPVQAPAAGRVVMARDLYLTGRTIILDHGFGLFTVYAHLSQFKVKRGESVARGELLGLSGATGRASGPHLHWGAVVHRTKFNPMDLTRLVR